MRMENKMLMRWLLAGILILIQGCAGASLNPFVEKPYFASPPAQLSSADKEVFDRALFRQTNNRIQPAIKVWGQFLEKHPRSFEAHNNLGLVYFEDDQLAAAIIEFEKAMSLEPSEDKIKKNLIRALNFKALLYKEANDYNRAVDTLKRVQEISTPEEKEKVGYRIEEYENQAFAQAKRVNTLEAYQAFLIRYPESSKNSDAARMKVEGLKLRPAAPPAIKAEASIPALPLETESEEILAGDDLLESSPLNMENTENMVDVTPEMKGLAEEKMSSSSPGLDPALGQDMQKEAMEKMEKVETGVKTPVVAETLDNGFIPVQPLEVPRSGEQKIAIATQPDPKPATGVDPFFKPESPKVKTPDPVVSLPVQNDPPEVAQILKKKVKIVTSKDPLRIRAGPTSASRVVATVAKGSLVPFVKEENGWYKIEFSAGETGWVSKKYSQMVE